MASRRHAGFTYQDLQAFPEDNLRRELIDGELVVTAAPPTRHQDVVVRLVVALGTYCQAHGGKVYAAPTDVYLSETNVVEPDVLYLGPSSLERVEKPFVRSAPDLVVEVSSPSTRHLDLVRKRELYERFRVNEFWFVDLNGDRVEVYLLQGGEYAPPQLLGRGEALRSPQIPELSIDVNDLLGPPED
jgi:Uma2 family endonuclease